VHRIVPLLDLGETLDPEIDCQLTIDIVDVQQTALLTLVMSFYKLDSKF